MADELKSSLSTSGTQPVSLTPAQEKLCRQLDELYDLYGLEPRPSAMFRGAIFAIREAQNNPDWLAQAAHSLREILYPLDTTKKILKKYGSVFLDKNDNNLGKIYGCLNKLAHHNSTLSKPDFENLIARFETSMQRALTRQSDVQNQIDEIVE